MPLARVACSLPGQGRRIAERMRCLRVAAGGRDRNRYARRASRPELDVVQKRQGGTMMGVTRTFSRSGLRLGGLCVAAAAGLYLGAPAPAAADSFTMGYSVGFLTDPFQAIQVDLTMAGAKAAGLKTLPVANANGDAGKQITDMRNLIAQGAQGIILVPTDSD